MLKTKLNIQTVERLIQHLITHCGNGKPHRMVRQTRQAGSRWHMAALLSGAGRTGGAGAVRPLELRRLLGEPVAGRLAGKVNNERVERVTNRATGGVEHVGALYRRVADVHDGMRLRH